MIRAYHTIDARDPETVTVEWSYFAPGDEGTAYELPAGVSGLTVAFSGNLPAGTIGGFHYSNDKTNWGQLVPIGDGVVHVGAPLPRFIKPGVDFTSPDGASVTFSAHVRFRTPAPAPQPAGDDSNVVSITA
jgi:hypothetical protein